MTLRGKARVITNENLNINPKQSNPETINRSLTGTNTGNLVGSHCNLMNYQDKKSNYWFSRLLEHFGIKLVAFLPYLLYYII